MILTGECRKRFVCNWRKTSMYVHSQYFKIKLIKTIQTPLIFESNLGPNKRIPERKFALLGRNCLIHPFQSERETEWERGKERKSFLLRNSFKQISYRPIAYNGSTLLYNLGVPEIPVRRPSQQIKTSAHYSTSTKGSTLDRRIEKTARSRDTQHKIWTHTQPKKIDTWLHNRSRSTKDIATRRIKK